MKKTSKRKSAAERRRTKRVRRWQRVKQKLLAKLPVCVCSLQDPSTCEREKGIDGIAIVIQDRRRHEVPIRLVSSLGQAVGADKSPSFLQPVYVSDMKGLERAQIQQAFSIGVMHWLAAQANPTPSS